MNNIIDKLKIEKSSKKLTNAELSSLSGVPLGTVNKILSGATKSVKAETLEKLTLAIFNGEVEVYENKPLIYGFLKVGACTPEIVLASPKDNAQKIIESVNRADEQGVSLLVFPKLCLTGSTLGDLYRQQSLISSALNSLFLIANQTAKLNVISVIGLPLLVKGKLYSVGAVISKGKILGFVPEQNPDNNLFSSFDGFENICINGNNIPFGDILFRANNYCDFTFSVTFSTDLAGLDKNYANCSVIACLSSMPETVGKTEKLTTLISAKTSAYNCGCVFAEAGYGESTTDCVYSGENFIYENGSLLNKSKKFTSQTITCDIDVDYLSSEKIKNSRKNQNAVVNEVNFNLEIDKFTLTRDFDKTPFIPKNVKMQERAELILSIQSHGLKRRVEHTHAKALVIGVSGGLDSTLALLVAVRTMKLLGRSSKDVIAITMPCFGTTERTKNNAYDLCNALNVTVKEINIKNAVNQHFEDIGQSADIHDVTFENSQARERTQVLMDYANKIGGIVVGTGDLSELALGWATYNGDHMSNYSVNASIPKTLIRYLVEYESLHASTLLKNTLADVLDTPVSPELVPPKEGEITQKTEDIVGPYILHDFYLYHAIKRCSSPSKIFYIAKHVFKKDFEPQVLYKWLENFYKRFFSQQFKRSCLPDGVKVGSVSLSPRGDFSMPSDAYATTWLDDLSKCKF